MALGKQASKEQVNAPTQNKSFSIRRTKRRNAACKAKGNGPWTVQHKGI